MLARGTTPVVNAWPSITVGAPDSTGSTIQRLELIAVEHPKFAERAVGIASEAAAEIVLTPGIDGARLWDKY